MRRPTRTRSRRCGMRLLRADERAAGTTGDLHGRRYVLRQTYLHAPHRVRATRHRLLDRGLGGGPRSPRTPRVHVRDREPGQESRRPWRVVAGPPHATTKAIRTRRVRDSGGTPGTGYRRRCPTPCREQPASPLAAVVVCDMNAPPGQGVGRSPPRLPRIRTPGSPRARPGAAARSRPRRDSRGCTGCLHGWIG